MFLGGIIALLPLMAAAAEETTAGTGVHSSGFLTPDDAPSGRHYAPDREVDVLHLTLEVTPDVPHVFVAFAGMLDEAGAALDSGARFIRSHLHTAS